MAKVKLVIRTKINEFTLKTILESHGHQICSQDYQIVITDNYDYARSNCSKEIILLLATAQQIPQAVELMKEGVYGYIFVPFQPFEAHLMIQHALGYQLSNPLRDRNSSTTLHDIEAETILRTLAECHFNRTETAKRLGIARNTLWRKLKKIKNMNSTINESS